MSAVIPDQGPAVATIERTAEILGIGKSTAYDLIARGEFPLPVRTVGRRQVVPLVFLERFLLTGDVEAVA